jgi:hypothetical protein
LNRSCCREITLLKDFAPAKRQALASFLAIFDLANDHGCGGVVASKYTLALHSFQISQATNMDGWFISPRLYCRSISWMPHHEGISFQIRVVNLHLYKRWPSIIFLFGCPNSILHNQTSKELVFFGSFSKDQSVAILVKINTCLTAFDIPTC